MVKVLCVIISQTGSSKAFALLFWITMSHYDTYIQYPLNDACDEFLFALSLTVVA